MHWICLEANWNPKPSLEHINPNCDHINIESSTQTGLEWTFRSLNAAIFVKTTHLVLKRESAVASLGRTVAPPRCCWLFLCDCFSVAGWSFSMGSAYQFHSWRVFVVVCALPCVSAVVALTFMPESPRFYLEVREKRCIVAAAAPFSLLMTLEMTLKGFQRTVEQPCFFLGFIFSH